MSERLQDLKRALTSGTGMPDPEGSGASRRSLSVSAMRKPSLSIRRTLSSFRCAVLQSAAQMVSYEVSIGSVAIIVLLCIGLSLFLVCLARLWTMKPQISSSWDVTGCALSAACEHEGSRRRHGWHVGCIDAWKAICQQRDFLAKSHSRAYVVGMSLLT